MLFRPTHFKIGRSVASWEPLLLIPWGHTWSSSHILRLRIRWKNAWRCLAVVHSDWHLVNLLMTVNWPCAWCKVSSTLTRRAKPASLTGTRSRRCTKSEYCRGLSIWALLPIRLSAVSNKIQHGKQLSKLQNIATRIPWAMEGWWEWHLWPFGLLMSAIQLNISNSSKQTNVWPIQTSWPYYHHFSTHMQSTFCWKIRIW